MLSGGGGSGRECTPAALLTCDMRGQQLALPFHQLNRNLVLRKTKFDPCGDELWPPNAESTPSVPEVFL
jgi:hypothetical protein